MVFTDRPQCFFKRAANGTQFIFNTEHTITNTDNTYKFHGNLIIITELEHVQLADKQNHIHKILYVGNGMGYKQRNMSLL